MLLACNAKGKPVDRDSVTNRGKASISVDYRRGREVVKVEGRQVEGRRAVFTFVS
jgi:hypothetical protein